MSVSATSGFRCIAKAHSLQLDLDRNKGYFSKVYGCYCNSIPTGGLVGSSVELCQGIFDGSNSRTVSSIEFLSLLSSLDKAFEEIR